MDKMALKRISQYETTDILTASREEILLRLYEACIRSIKQAKEAISLNQKADKAKHIVKAQNIVCELRASLDFKRGGEIAADLDRLYAFVTEQLLNANLNHDAMPLEGALRVLETLEQGWIEAIKSLKEKSKK